MHEVAEFSTYTENTTMYHVAEEGEAKKHYILETALGQMKHRINVKTYFKDFFMKRFGVLFLLSVIVLILALIQKPTPSSFWTVTEADHMSIFKAP